MYSIVPRGHDRTVSQLRLHACFAHHLYILSPYHIRRSPSINARLPPKRISHEKRISLLCPPLNQNILSVVIQYTIPESPTAHMHNIPAFTSVLISSYVVPLYCA